MSEVNVRKWYNFIISSHIFIRECFPAYRYCVKSKIEILDKISDIKLTVLQLKKKCPNSMSEVNVRKWHNFIISSHF